MRYGSQNYNNFLHALEYAEPFLSGISQLAYNVISVKRLSDMATRFQLFHLSNCRKPPVDVLENVNNDRTFDRRQLICEM